VNDSQLQFLRSATVEAIKANHPFAMMAAAEAALESNWGNSSLAREDFNLFGTKQHAHPIFGTVNLPTREWDDQDHNPIDGKWMVVTASWVKYPDWRASFCDRLATLERLSNAYPHYKAALDAKDPLTFVTEVSKSWSTDPRRAAKVISIYQDYLAMWGKQNPPAPPTPAAPTPASGS
jgi:lysozyme